MTLALLDAGTKAAADEKRRVRVATNFMVVLLDVITCDLVAMKVSIVRARDDL